MRERIASREGRRGKIPPTVEPGSPPPGGFLARVVRSDLPQPPPAHIAQETVRRLKAAPDELRWLVVFALLADEQLLREVPRWLAALRASVERAHAEAAKKRKGSGDQNKRARQRAVDALLDDPSTRDLPVGEQMRLAKERAGFGRIPRDFRPLIRAGRKSRGLD